MRTIKTPGVCRCGKQGCQGSRTIELLLHIDSDDESELLDDLAGWLDSAKKAGARLAIEAPAPPVAALQRHLELLNLASKN